MDKQAIQAAMKAITTGVGRKSGGGGGGNSDKRREALVERLRVGTRTTGKGKVVAFNAAQTARMAASLIKIGGTVPPEVAARYSFVNAAPAVRALATAMGVDGDALLAALTPAPQGEIPVGDEQETEHEEPVRLVGGGARRRR